MVTYIQMLLYLSQYKHIKNICISNRSMCFVYHDIGIQKIFVLKKVYKKLHQYVHFHIST